MTITQHVQRDTARAVAALPAHAVSDVVAIGSDGDTVAWDEVLRQYGTLVSTTVRSFRLQDADARDAVQATWLRLVENAHRVQWSERLGGVVGHHRPPRMSAYPAPNQAHPGPR